MYSVEKSIKKAIDGTGSPAAPEVPPVAAAAAARTGGPMAPPPPATAENVPGLDAALVDPLAPPEPAPVLPPAAPPRVP